ncbi:hypothetical protein RUM43_011859 [Polyplax serrata]|uniref:Uncharacterized protein n=1 Tax=Polyplax serrata TaxID=468196 RepID=A0AAN8PJV9_POLSC
MNRKKRKRISSTGNDVKSDKKFFGGCKMRAKKNRLQTSRIIVKRNLKFSWLPSCWLVFRSEGNEKFPRRRRGRRKMEMLMEKTELLGEAKGWRKGSDENTNTMIRRISMYLPSCLNAIFGISSSVCGRLKRDLGIGSSVINGIRLAKYQISRYLTLNLTLEPELHLER